MRRRLAWRRLRVDFQVACRALYSSSSVVSMVAEGDEERDDDESLELVLWMRLAYFCFMFSSSSLLSSFVLVWFGYNVFLWRHRFSVVDC